ncbi:2-keto-4-pentenoate hydratase [Terrarubrum flagellatum]|uniref:2-keto-4-pentenoate hydratase n=1 Tax=Terrirubrum flagellatum TaxID=2895980 RepID=UPI0031454A2E
MASTHAATLLAADALLAARRDNILLEVLPGASELATDDDAYAVQETVRQGLGQTIAAWKVSVIEGRPPGYAPILSGAMVANGGTWRLDAGRKLLGIEAEIAFIPARDIVGRADGKPLSEDEVADHLAGAVVVIEVCESRFRDSSAQPRLAAIADFMANGAFVHGGPAVDWRKLDLATIPVKLTIGGRAVADKKGGNPAVHPLTATTWLANALIARGTLVKAGQIVTTGSYTGLSPVAAGDRAVAAFEGVGECEISFGA